MHVNVRSHHTFLYTLCNVLHHVSLQTFYNNATFNNHFTEAKDKLFTRYQLFVFLTSSSKLNGVK